MELSSASFAYPQHEGAIRAELARRLIGARPPEGGFLLSTCLRVEVVVPGSDDLLEPTLDALFGEMVDDARPQIRRGERAVAHLYRIAAGLESPILGESEILTQFRQSLIAAEESGAVGGVFARLLESAVSVGRQARELLPKTPHNSMAAVAAQVAGNSDRVAVLGSGIMATAVVDSLLSLPAPPEITVVARHPEKVAGQAGVEVFGFDHAIRALRTFPTVISATSAKHGLVDDEEMATVISERREPLLLIDMAMPPDFGPPLATEMVAYVTVDDLARMADRRSRSDDADALVEAAASAGYRQYRDHYEIGPLIGSLMAGADELVDSAVKRFAGRLGDPEDEAILRQAAHTVARALLAGPVSYLKEESRPREAVDVIADAFGVDDG